MTQPTQIKTALITGAAARIGAEIARTLHAAGMNIVIHYRSSADKANALRDELNQQRTNSAHTLQADLLNTPSLGALVSQSAGVWGGLDVLVNNASSFYPTPVGEITEAHTLKLQDAIIQHPEQWLWSHKRWKREIPENLEQLKLEQHDKFQKRYR